MVKSLVFVSLAVAVLAACAGVADLDVKYKDTGVADGGDSSVGTTSPPVDAATRPLIAPPLRDAASSVDTTTLGQAAGACPCDAPQGLACCSTANGASCSADQASCDAQNGAFLRCAGPDFEGSYCCLHRHGASSETALAAACEEGFPIVCTFDTDCPNGKCTLGSCPGGVTIGTCDGTPVCP
jgi:hypothetical protein